MEDKGQEEVNKVDKVDDARKVLEYLTNQFGCQEDLGSLALKMSTIHRTLVQSFTGGFVIPFIRELDRMKRSESFDARNEEACNACLCMYEALEKEYGIGEGDDLSFLMV